MSTITSHITYMTEVIFNSVIFGVGIIVAVAVPVIINRGLDSISSKNRQSPSKDLSETKSAGNPDLSFWAAVLIFTIMATITAYIVLVCQFWNNFDSITGVVVKSTITIIAASVGLAIPALVRVFIDRAFGRT